MAFLLFVLTTFVRPANATGIDHAHAARCARLLEMTGDLRFPSTVAGANYASGYAYAGDPDLIFLLEELMAFADHDLPPDFVLANRGADLRQRVAVLHRLSWAMMTGTWNARRWIGRPDQEQFLRRVVAAMPKAAWAIETEVLPAILSADESDLEPFVDELTVIAGNFANIVSAAHFSVALLDLVRERIHDHPLAAMLAKTEFHALGQSALVEARVFDELLPEALRRASALTYALHPLAELNWRLAQLAYWFLSAPELPASKARESAKRLARLLMDGLPKTLATVRRMDPASLGEFKRNIQDLADFGDVTFGPEFSVPLKRLLKADFRSLN